MSTPKKRSYNSISRKAQADETRRRILESAIQLIQMHGFESVTIENIAQKASVSLATIYALYQSKRGILLAIMDDALPSQQFEAYVLESDQEKNAKKRLLIAAKIARQMYDAEKQLMDIFRGASVLTPEFKELENEREQRRYKRQEKTIQDLVKEKALISSLDQTKARDLLWAFTGRDLYRMLVIDRGWSSDEYESWLGMNLIKTLITES